jgi:hypothetical protein
MAEAVTGTGAVPCPGARLWVSSTTPGTHHLCTSGDTLSVVVGDAGMILQLPVVTDHGA